MLKERRHTLQVRVGAVMIGGSAPIAVQSMTNTDTADVEATFTQVRQLARARLGAGAHHCEQRRSRRGGVAIRDRLRAAGVTVPLIGDLPFQGHKLLREYPDCAQALDKYRINPGNVDAAPNATRSSPK